MSHDQGQAFAKGAPDATVDTRTPERKVLEDDWKFVAAYAEGKGSQSELAKHIAGLGDSMSLVIPLMPKIAKRTAGGIVLECAATLRMPLADQIQLALHAKEPVSAAALREHLRQLSASDLAELDAHPDLIHELRAKALTGPLAVELPELASVPIAIYTKANLVEWYVESMNPALACVQLANIAGNPVDLVATLDALATATPKAWGWLDAIHIQNIATIGFGLVDMRNATKNVAARDKLTALTQHFQPDMAKRTADTEPAKADFAAQVVGKDDAQFLDAAARTQGDAAVDRSKVPSRLVGAAADTVFQYLSTLPIDGPKSISDGIHLLHGAKGATREHVTMFLVAQAATDVTGAMANDTTRKELRQLVGRGAALRTLFRPEDATGAHPLVVADEALRNWAYEDPSPENLLWIAAGSAPGASTGCRLVQREKGNGWVQQVPRDASKDELRRFVLATTDSTSATWIKANLLHDAKHVVDPEQNKVEATDNVVYGQGASFRPEALGYGADSKLVLARLADLNASERAEMLAHPDHVNAVLSELMGHELRVVELLAPTLTQLVKFPIADAPELVDYVSTRSPAEQLTATRNPSAMRKLLGPISPFIALPALRQPDVLATALADNNGLLSWIFEDTDASQALALLSRDPARKVVAALMESNDQSYAGLPAYDHLRKAGQKGFDRIAEEIKDDSTKREVDDYKSGDTSVDAGVDKHAKDTRHATAVGNLVANIADIIDKGGSRADLLAVVQSATPTQQIELLSGDHDAAVTTLRSHVGIGPQHVFFDLSVAQLLSLPSAATWLLGGQPPTTALHLVASDPGATTALGRVLSSKRDLADTFAGALPRGAALTSAERHVLDDLSKHVADPGALHQLFSARFDVEIESTYDAPETKRLWSVLQRLPPAQVDQNVIHSFKLKSLGGPVGDWSRPDIDLEQDSATLAGNDRHYDRGIEMTADEVKKYYGLDDKALKLAADPNGGWLVAQNGNYIVKEIDPRQFDATVIHEVGHSVDTLLGEQTELVYGLAGWKRYGYDQFDEWANQMGAFENVSSTDRPRIVEAWKQALHAHTAVSKLVGSDHPAITNTASPLAKHVDEDPAFAHKDRTLQPVHGTVFLQTPTTLATVNKQAWDAAPTDYSLTTPQEYFAECYVEYYCRFDGTQATEGFKGGRLPVWIKKWFDEHVDKIRLSPHRVHEGLGDKT